MKPWFDLGVSAMRLRQVEGKYGSLTGHDRAMQSKIQSSLLGRRAFVSSSASTHMSAIASRPSAEK